MGIYSKYLICYDIEQDKTRKKFFEGMKDLGLVPIQQSVFYGDLTYSEFTALKRLAKDMLDAKTDKCLWLRCTLEVNEVKKFIGYNNFSYSEPDGYVAI